MEMIRKLLKMLPAIFLLAAQLIVSAHLHSPANPLPHGQCAYCQIAADIQGGGTPDTVSLPAPDLFFISEITSETDIFSRSNAIDGHYTRAPPAINSL